jgi:hypothetical protein
MTSALRILEEITTGYSIFEKDQVLTESQLNSITNYLNDRTRLTSIYLLGVGVVSGLRVSLSSDVIKVTPGIGVTTDGDLLYYSDRTVIGVKTNGDLLYYSNETVFNRYREYDNSNPKYEPFYLKSEGSEEKMIPVYELIPQDAEDRRSGIFDLGEFSSQTTKDLKNMVAVLLMESYVKDLDICTATDCDNLGQDCINTTKLLLVEKDSINSLLKPAIATPDAAFNTLNEIVADRPSIGSSINSVSALAEVYRTVCTTIHNKLLTELRKLYPNCAAFLTDVFSSDPTSGWVTRLTEIERQNAARSDVGIQYYYDFLKDVVETYNQFRDLLFGDNTWCCPDINWFPKHLLLGNLVVNSDADPDENRTDFYPSPAISQTAESLNHAKFLARKLDTLIQTFQIPRVSTAADSIRITPSFFEDHPLEERAIPYYYQVNLEQANSIHKCWNYHLHQRRMDNRNYSYNAVNYRAQGAAANPLGSQIGKFSFFRIEGHLGQNVETVLSRIESEIKSKNLPFTVRSVLLGQDKTKVVKKPGIRYSDLHRFHYLLRQDAHHQLQEVTQFSKEFKKKVDENVAGESNAQSLIELAAQSNGTVTQNAESVGKKLNRSYIDYQADRSWQPSLLATITAASEFKSNISPVLKTEFATPFDSLISNTRILWLDWLDEIIKKKDETEDEKLLFTSFVSQNPGIEHFAGVLRGGTFVLVYDNNNTVVADFMLSYYYEDKVEEAPVEPTLTKPTIRPDIIINRGIRVLPSFDRRLSDFRGVLEPDLTKKFALQEKYFDIYKGFVDTSTSIFTAVGNIKPEKYTDPVLDVQIREVGIEQEKVGLLKQRATQQPDNKAASTRAIQAEVELAQSLVAIADYIATSNISVAGGSEGSKAMQVVSDISVTITQRNALETLRGGLNTVVKNNPNNAEFVAIIRSILSRLG